MAKISIGGVSREMTAEEITELETMQAEVKVSEDTLKAKDVQTSLDKASGKQKLKDLGLSDDEITALTG